MSQQDFNEEHTKVTYFIKWPSVDHTTLPDFINGPLSISLALAIGMLRYREYRSSPHTHLLERDVGEGCSRWIK